MKSLNRIRSGLVSACMMAAGLGLGTPATAADPPDFTELFPAGVACDFDLFLEGRGFSQVFKVFVDKNGNPVRFLVAGRGSALTFINDSTGASLSLRANGSVQHVSLNPDGSSTWVATGHTVLILFPTDIPAGPSTTLHVGRVVFTSSVNNDFEVLQVSGRTTNICAALSD